MLRIIFFVAFLFSVSAYSQGLRNIDSLKNLLIKNKLDDTSRVKVLLNLADAVLYNDPDTAMHYTNEAFALAKKIQWQMGIALSYRQKGNVYYLASDNLNAMDCFQKALREGASLKNPKLEATVYNNIANIYSDMKQYNKALDNYNLLLTTAHTNNMRKEETIALVNLGTVYTELENYDKALQLFSNGLVIAEKDSNMRLLPFILSNMGILYNKKEMYNDALKSFERSIELAEAENSNNSKGPAFQGMAKAYLGLKNITKAEQFANLALQSAEDIGSFEWQQNSWEILSAVYEAQHKDSKALQAYKKYILYQDSVLSDEKKQELTRKEMEFDFENKTALIKAEHSKQQAIAEEKIKQQAIVKNSAVAGAVILLFAGISTFVFYKRKRDAEEEKIEANFKAHEAETEMKVLRLQMNPHFIFNSLNSISNYISRHDIKMADHYLTGFAKLMRMMLEYSEQKAISLEEDLKALELYIQLESLRMNHAFTYEIKVDENIDQETTLVPPMILQPFVENSIWHGIANKESEGKICIEIKKEDEMINCIVEDNGAGRMKQSSEAERKSLGMKITKARIDILNRIKKSKAAVELTDLTQGLRVEVKLPLELSY